MSQNRRNPNSLLAMRGLAVFAVLYMLWPIVQSYIAGGEEAPTLGMLLLAIAVLGGCAVFIAFLGWKEWKRAKADEAAELEARQSEAEPEEPET